MTKGENSATERMSPEAKAARAAVLNTPLFPDLERRLVAAFSPGPGLLAHQILYWYSLPKMASRNEIYKTAEEFKAERGLSRRQVTKARAVLTQAGVLEERRGAGGKLYYRVRWVALAQTLNLEFSSHAVGVQSGSHAKEEQTGIAPVGVQSGSHAKGDHSHSKEYEETSPITFTSRESSVVEQAPTTTAKTRNLLNQPKNDEPPDDAPSARQVAELVEAARSALQRQGIDAAQATADQGLGALIESGAGELTGEAARQFAAAWERERREGAAA